METQTAGITKERLAKLGFKSLAETLERKKITARKMALAYELYRFVRPEKIKAFNDALKTKTLDKKTYRYDVLVFTSLDVYEQIPPEPVLCALEEAIGCGIFDSFEIASIQSVAPLPDPILFGRIEGCTDRFFIAQWDDDVKISDLIGPQEG